MFSKLEIWSQCNLFLVKILRCYLIEENFFSPLLALDHGVLLNVFPISTKIILRQKMCLCFCLLTGFRIQDCYQSVKKPNNPNTNNSPPPQNAPWCVNIVLFPFSNVYLQVKAISNIVWKYQRYHFIMAYHEKPVLPPPLIILSHMASLFCCICKRRKTDKTSDGPSMNSYPKKLQSCFWYG